MRGCLTASKVAYNILFCSISASHSFGKIIFENILPVVSLCFDFKPAKQYMRLIFLALSVIEVIFDICLITISVFAFEKSITIHNIYLLVEKEVKIQFASQKLLIFKKIHFFFLN